MLKNKHSTKSVWKKSGSRVFPDEKSLAVELKKMDAKPFHKKPERIIHGI